MAWIKINDDYINLEQVYRFTINGSQIIFYDANGVLPTAYTFGSPAEAQTFLNKLRSINQTIDIDNLANQG